MTHNQWSLHGHFIFNSFKRQQYKIVTKASLIKVGQKKKFKKLLFSLIAI